MPSVDKDEIGLTDQQIEIHRAVKAMRRLKMVVGLLRNFAESDMPEKLDWYKHAVSKAEDRITDILPGFCEEVGKISRKSNNGLG